MKLFNKNLLSIPPLGLLELKHEIDELLTTAGSAAFLLNEKLEVQFFTSKTKELYNISGESLGKKISEVEGYFSECDVSFYANKIFETGNRYRGKITTAQGKHYMKRMAPYTSGERGIVGVIVAFIDITEVENAKLELEKSEHRFRDLVECSTDYIFELNELGIFTFVSKQVKDILGYDAEYLTGRSIVELIMPDELQRIIEASKAFDSGSGEHNNMVHHVKKHNGEIITVDASVRTVLDENGKLIGYRAMHRDITPQITAEKEQKYLSKLLENKVESRTQELKAKQEELLEAQRIGKLGNWLYDCETGKTSWSDMIFTIFDLQPREDINDSYFDARIHPDDIEAVHLHKQEMLNGTAASASVQYRILDRHDNIKYAETTVNIIRDAKGKALKVAGVTQDITQLKLQEEERKQLIADLLQRNKDLQQFNYIVSHNLRAPVANLIGLTGIYDSTLKNAARNEGVIENIKESAENLDEVLRDLSHILHIGSNISNIKENVDMDASIKQVLKTLELQIRESNADIQVQYGKAPILYTVKSYITSIVYNLISNSIKYKDHTRPLQISVNVEVSKKKLKIFFVDNGLGMDIVKNNSKLFGLYKRFHTHTDGKGIGLYLVKVQTEALGGSIEVESEIDKGTAFILSLPI
jgi:PAS domain S-box-containing protein